MRWESWMAYDERPNKPFSKPEDPNGAAMAWGNFCKIVFYGYARWPSYCEWMVPGTITDVERAH